MERIKKWNDDEKSQEETFKKIKNVNKLLENKLEKIQKETSKSYGEKIQVVEKGTNTDQIHITAQKHANLVEEQHIRMLEHKRRELQAYTLIEVHQFTKQQGENKIIFEIKPRRHYKNEKGK